MKKVFLVFMSLMFIICLAGCDEKEEKINIDFIIDGKSYLVEIDKGTSISKDIIPLSDEEEVIKLFYDENMENEYDGKALNEDSKMYVKTDTIDLENYLNKAEQDELIIKSAYCNYINNSLNSSFGINDFDIKYYLGKLSENKYVVVMHNDIRLHTTQSSNPFKNKYFVGGVTFKWLPEIISIICDEKYYDIRQAYEFNIISQNELQVIKNIYDYVIINK